MSDGVFSVSQWVFAFKPGEAADLIRAVKQKCSKLAAAAGDSSTNYHAIDLPQLGDEAFGVHGLSATASVYIRRGDLVTLLLVGSKGDPASYLSQLAAKADSKLASVGPIPLPTSVP